MEEKIKQRIIGILVLIGSLFIILPVLFHNSNPSTEQQKITVVTPNKIAPPVVSVTLPAENSTTSSVNAVPANTTSLSTATTTAAATVNAPVITGSMVSTTPANTSVTENAAATATSSTVAPSAISQIQSTQPAQVAVKVASLAKSVKKTVVAGSAKLNSNTIASTPDASGFKPDQAVSPTSGLTTGIPISTPSTTEVTPSSPASTAQSAVANVQTQSITEPVSTHTALHHKQVIKTVHHSHHTMHAMHGKRWEIQLAVFSNEHNAKQLMAKLHAHHFAAYTRRVTHHGRHMTAVFVGPELNHQKTLAMQGHLKREFHLSGVVKRV